MLYYNITYVVLYLALLPDELLLGFHLLLLQPRLHLIIMIIISRSLSLVVLV